MFYSVDLMGKKGSVFTFECEAISEGEAIKLALATHPGCRFVDSGWVHIELFDHIRVGATLWWADPDNGKGTGPYKVRRIYSANGIVEDERTLVSIKGPRGKLRAPAGQLKELPSVGDLANDLMNSENDEGREDGYTLVHKTRLVNLVAEVEKYETRLERANVFFTELINSVEDISGIAEQHGVATLVDLLYLHDAILKKGKIQVAGDSKIRDVLHGLPSVNRWMKFIKE